jgi:hypothetical protein
MRRKSEKGFYLTSSRTCETLWRNVKRISTRVSRGRGRRVGRSTSRRSEEVGAVAVEEEEEEEEEEEVVVVVVVVVVERQWARAREGVGWEKDLPEYAWDAC